MEPEQERGHNPEVAAAAADRPEELRVALGIGRDELARCQDDVRLEEAVDGQAEAAAQVADAATEGQAEIGRASCRERVL